MCDSEARAEVILLPSAQGTGFKSQGLSVATIENITAVRQTLRCGQLLPRPLLNRLHHFPKSLKFAELPEFLLCGK